MSWLFLANGAILCLIGLRMAWQEIRAEWSKEPAERLWLDVLQRMKDAKRETLCGFLLVSVAIFDFDYDIGFRFFVAPLGLVLAVALVIDVVARVRAYREPEAAERFDALSHQCRRIMLHSSGAIVAACLLYALVLLGQKVDDLAARLEALERRPLAVATQSARTNRPETLAITASSDICIPDR